MKLLNILLFIAILSGAIIGFTSCEEDFLETSPSDEIADEDAFDHIDGAQAVLNGLYYHQRRYSAGGQDRFDDHGIPTVNMMNDAAAGQEKVVWGGWYPFDYSLQGYTRSTVFRTRQLWNFYYRTINNVNSILANIDDAEGPQEAKDEIIGQAKALRAYAYFNLVRFFQHTYVIAEDMPGVPIYTEPATGEAKGNPREPVSDVYDFILEDLTAAIPLLETYQRAGRKSAVDQSVAQGFLAEVYLTMNKWEEAANAAADARAGYPIMTPEEFQAGFNDLSCNEWMWAAPQTTDDNLWDYSPFAFWDWNRGRWQWNNFFLNDVFVEEFDEEDIRYEQMEPDPWGEGLYITSKFTDNADQTGDIVIMRAATMLLIEAEALARAGRDDEAKEVLWELQDNRNAPRTESSGEELIEDILLERRKELYGEGYSWFDLIRNQKPMYREGVHKDGITPRDGLEIWPERSWRFIYQIPQSELEANENMSDRIWPDGDQNPYDGVFNP